MRCMVCCGGSGCVAQQEGQKIATRFPEIDLVIGPQYANRIGDLLEEVMQGNQVREPLGVGVGVAVIEGGRGGGAGSLT